MGELSTQKATILIVEDDSFSQAILNMFLGQYYQTVVANNGKQALAHIQSGLQPQLIISDLNTPEMTGFQLLQHLKAHKDYHTIPFVVLCGDDSEAQKQHCTHAGAAAYILKPFNPTSLNVLIQSLLGMDD